MARKYAALRLDMLADVKFRALTGGAQRLYMTLLAHNTLTYCGVADWRPKRLAHYTSDSTVESIEAEGAELAAGLFIVIDEDTDEVLIRSYIKYDEVMRQWRLAASLAASFGSIVSDTIRAVVVDELEELQTANPHLPAWERSDVLLVLSKPSKSAKEIYRDSGAAWGKLTPNFAPDSTPNTAPTAAPSEGQAIPKAPSLTVNQLPISISISNTAGIVAERDGVIDELIEPNLVASKAKPKHDIEALFSQAYAHWPKKVERIPALEKFKIAVRTHDPLVLVAEIVKFGDAYAATTEKQYTPALGVWISRKRWTDDLPSAARGQPKSNIENHLDVVAMLREREQRTENEAHNRLEIGS